MTTIEVSDVTRAKLHDLALARGEPEYVVAEKAIELYRRQSLLDEINAGYAALRADSDAWRNYQTEVADWDETVADGLEDD